MTGIKYFLALLLIACSLTGQTIDKVRMYNALNQQYATLYNGTDAYLTRTNPTGLDLSGAEMITTETSRTFETNVGEWVGNGNHSIAQSSTDKRTGTYSGAITASAAGSATGNSVDLATIGADVLSGWDLTNWTPTGISQDNITSTGFRAPTTGSNGVLSKTGIMTIGLTYKITISGTRDGGTKNFVLYASTGGGVYCDLGAANFSVTIYAVASATGLQLAQSSVGTSTTITITTLKCELVTQAITPITSADIGKKFCVEGWARAEAAGTKVTAVVGSKSQQSGTLSTTAGTFTKFVLNFQATASEVGQPIKLYFNQADVVYVDDVSMKPKKDFIILGGVSSTRTPYAGDRILSTASFHIGHSGALNGSLICGITDGTVSPFCNGLTYILGTRPSAIAVTFDAVNGLRGYKDGVAINVATSTATLGNLPATTQIVIGATLVGTSPWQGLEYPLQMITFDALPSDGGASIVADAYNRFRSNRPYASSYGGTNAAVVGSWDWKSGYNDRTGVNHLTPVNNPPFIRVRN
jgi:hypothetical protein